MFGKKAPTGGIELAEVTVDIQEARRQRDRYREIVGRASESRTLQRYDPKATALAVQQRLDIGLAATFEAIVNGEKVINIEDTFKKTGVDRLDRPRVALAYANWRRVRLGRRFDGSFDMRDDFDSDDRKFTFTPGTIKRIENGFQATAPVPVIPALLRPDNLNDKVILFEPVWTGQAAPKHVDPILLRHLGGMLYVVIATWDVSPIEQAILRGL